MGKRILVTGGAGFVGSHLVDELVDLGHDVIVYDSLEAQVHGTRTTPTYLNKDCRLVVGDVRDGRMLGKVLHRVDAIYHFAAIVGVGQSMYEIDRYVDANVHGTASLLQAILDKRVHPEKLIVASSMSIYGEGRYVCPSCSTSAAPGMRTIERLRAHQWEMSCQECGTDLIPIPTDESKPLNLGSIYALSKYDQEEMCLIFGKTYEIPTVVLRYFNIYGPRQALSNPYTGVAAIFSSQLLNNRPPQVFEDGAQLRDFVSVHDIVRANLLALERKQADYHSINIGGGRPISIKEVASIIAEKLGKQIEPNITRKYRMGDIRHCFADIGLAERILGYKASVDFEAGVEELTEWLRSQRAEDRIAAATAQLESHGLTV